MCSWQAQADNRCRTVKPFQGADLRQQRGPCLEQSQGPKVQHHLTRWGGGHWLEHGWMLWILLLTLKVLKTQRDEGGVVVVGCSFLSQFSSLSAQAEWREKRPKHRLLLNIPLHSRSPNAKAGLYDNIHPHTRLPPRPPLSSSSSVLEALEET